MASWFRRGRHHVARVGPRSRPEHRGYEVVERVKVEASEEIVDTGRTMGGWKIVEKDGKQFFVMDVVVRWPEEWSTDVDKSLVLLEPPPGRVEIPVLGAGDSVAHLLRHDVPVAEIVEGWHGKSGPTP